MEFTPKTKKTIGIVAVIIAAFVFVWGYYKWQWFGGPAPSLSNGDECKVRDSSGVEIDGIWQDGVCVPTSIGPGNPSGETGQRTEPRTPRNPLKNF